MYILRANYRQLKKKCKLRFPNRCVQLSSFLRARLRSLFAVPRNRERNYGGI